MDFSKFISMLEHEALWFSRVDLLGDEYEGTYSVPDREQRKFKEHPQAEEHEKLHRFLRKWTLVNCWHMNAYESVGMWSEYANNGDGVAIRSTYQKLCDCLDENCYVGTVKYKDYSTDTFAPPLSNFFLPFVHKQVFHRFEEELRAVRAWSPPTIPLVGDPPSWMKYELKNDEGKPVIYDYDREPSHEGGWYFIKDFTRLMDEIVVGPKSRPWFKKLVEKTLVRYGLATVPVVLSRLCQKPLAE
jgi:hypothetical protein